MDNAIILSKLGIQPGRGSLERLPGQCNPGQHKNENNAQKYFVY